MDCDREPGNKPEPQVLAILTLALYLKTGFNESRVELQRQTRHTHTQARPPKSIKQHGERQHTQSAHRIQTIQLR